MSELSAWIGQVSGEDAVRDLESSWDDYSNHHEPVATLFGAFDTGKSSILRRLLVDSGAPVPTWLTVSARHETYADNIAEVDGCLIRDTPGLSPEGVDARSVKNSHVARSALGLTDVLMVTVNPQLSTGERPELLDVLAMGWPSDAVWFLISRADEGGIDPSLDPAGFGEWSDQKRGELRESLELAEDARIFVIVPDYAGLGAFEPDPDPTVWDESRSWDGIAALHTALADLSSEDISEHRSAARSRLWTQAVAIRLPELQAALEELTISRDSADASVQRRNIFLKQIDSLDDAADAALSGAIEDAIRRAANSPQIDADSIKMAVEPVLEEWWQKQHIGLSRIRRDALQAFEQQRESRGWSTLESVYRSFVEPDKPTMSKPLNFIPRLTKVAQTAQAGLEGADQILRSRLAQKSPEKAKDILESVGKLGVAAQIAGAALPAVTQLASFIQDEVEAHQDGARQREEREQARRAVADVARDAARNAMNTLRPEIAALKEEIAAQAVSEAEVQRLRDEVRLKGDLLARGRSLIAR
ncbi:GTPase domain-containing protein [Microbacterium ureisolvens]|uniref:GTPase domain-containing protein n=1 Tax=Microbacterium ureisolvens TaxID=2781186 RepID=UPI003644FC34